ncbi:hypothetical protein [Catellatospora chokoriensis]|uniref:Anti-sigma-D factor RsdA sigma factor binding region domain-containing protein n=1 Tax=Catellatospora chokoriensis TaxID=310353 RepID=A0A8J3JQW0_9ACTN|nr:hypothetical protein [Catellatospora chokoriensis]GIF89432.1 hypothetical protein Cch02nite_28760 [Catellatospora chokoriensis]
MSTLDRDDALLDGLGLGGAAHADDPLAGMLAAWRTDLAEPPFAPTLDLDIAAQAALADPIDLDEEAHEEPAAAVLRPAAGRPVASSAPDHVITAGEPATGRRDARRSSRPPGRGGTARPVRGGRLRPGRLLLAAALLVAVLGGGVVVGAGAGQPGTPLWPVTQLVYAARADSRVAAQETEELLARADRALQERRHDDAEQLLRQAWDHLGQVREKSDHQRLRTELMRLLAAFAAVTAQPSASPTPGSSPRPAGGTTAPTSAPTGAPTPSPTPGAGGLLPGLPPLLPSLPPILPSLLPDLPLL